MAVVVLFWLFLLAFILAVAVFVVGLMARFIAWVVRENWKGVLIALAIILLLVAHGFVSR